MHPYELALQLIRHFGKTLGLEDLTLEAGTHGCALEFDSDIVVTFEFHEASERIVLTSLVGVMPQINAEPILRALAMANFSSYLDGAITLGLEPQSQQIALMQSRSLSELDNATFEALVEGFVNRAETWKRDLEQLVGAGAAAGVPSGAMSDSGALHVTMDDDAQTSLPTPPDGAHRIYG